MSKIMKSEISDELLNELVEIVLEVKSIEDANDMFFSVETMRKNGVAKKYMEHKMSEKLRKCLYVKKCEKISEKIENNITEKDIINILRIVLKLKNYKLVGLNDNKTIIKSRVYTINPVV